MGRGWLERPESPAGERSPPARSGHSQLARSRQVADERTLVEAGIHSRRRAADALGVEDPDAEFSRWLEEERAVGTRQSAVGADHSTNGVAAV